MKTYIGECSLLQLALFARRVMGFRSSFLLNGNLGLPDSLRRKTCHAAYAKDGTRLSPDRVVGLGRRQLRVGVFETSERIHEVRYTSKRGNGCRFTRIDALTFRIELTEKTKDCCFYRNALKGQGVGLSSLQQLPESPTFVRRSAGW